MKFSSTITALLFVSTAVAAALPAHAGKDDEERFAGAHAGVAANLSAVAATRELAALRESQLRATLVAMNDGELIGGNAVVQALAGRRITFQPIDEPYRIDVAHGNGIILAESLKPEPRVYGPILAQATMSSLYADLPDCAERTALRSTTPLSVYLELGGDMKSAASDPLMSRYTLNPSFAVQQALSDADAGVKGISDLIDDERDPARRKELTEGRTRINKILMALNIQR